MSTGAALALALGAADAADAAELPPQPASMEMGNNKKWHKYLLSPDLDKDNYYGIPASLGLGNTEDVYFHLSDLKSPNAFAPCYFSSYFKLTFRVEDIASYPIDYFSPDLVQQSVIIACSISGEYADEISYVRNYHTSGCKLIAITANRKSVLGTLADICIAYPMPLIMSPSAMPQSKKRSGNAFLNLFV